MMCGGSESLPTLSWKSFGKLIDPEKEYVVQITYLPAQEFLEDYQILSSNKSDPKTA
jgi:hypothetical protein